MAKKEASAKKPAAKPAKDAAPAKPRVYEADLQSDFADDPMNANAGTERGHGMLERSVGEFGAARSLVADKGGRIVAGNKTREALLAAGIRSAVVVETDGKTPVIVKRTDFDLLKKGDRSRRYAFADNRVAEVDLSWDASVLRAEVDGGLDLSAYFSERELEQLLEADRAEKFDPNGEWQGMPEFDQNDETPAQRIVMNFKSSAAALAFGRLIGQPVTERTRSLWYPPVEPGSETDKRYVAEDEDDRDDSDDGEWADE